MTHWKSNKGNLYSAFIDSRNSLKAQIPSEALDGCFDFDSKKDISKFF